MKVKEVLEKINLNDYDVIFIDKNGKNILFPFHNNEGEVPLHNGVLEKMSDEIKEMEVKYYHCDFGEIYIKVK